MNQDQASARYAFPARQGVGASTVVLPEGPWQSVIDFLCARFSKVPRSTWEARLANGEVFNAHGQALQRHSPYLAHTRLYYYRSVAHEPRIPFEATVLYQDADLVVVDKPHFLPVTPSGKYLQETLLVRLKNQLGLDTLSPIHRIDRDTAGLVLFSVNPATRGAYQALFRLREVEKTYHAIAPWNPALPWPIARSSRIAPSAHFMQQSEVPGAANAHTTIAPLAQHAAWALYALHPSTGQRHQLRVHMAALGLPILNDGIYPHLTPEGPPCWERPLQLLAHSLAFMDPISGKKRKFTSNLRLKNLENLSPEP